MKKSKILEGAKYVGDKFTVASETGHQHVIEGVKVYSKGQQTLIVVQKPTKLTHPQHAEIELQEGIYSANQIQDYLAGQRLD